jgi:putative FmdB family regulatory protein
MPIYEFHCTDCDRSFETLVRPGHDEDAECPSCHGDHLSRELSVFASGRVNGDTASAAPAGPAAMRGGGGCCGGGCGCH